MMMEYLEELLGIKVMMNTWDKIAEFPVYLRREREYYLLQTEEQSCIIVKLLSQEFSLSTIQKQIQKLETYTDKNIILWLDDITTYQRQALVKNKIAFIVPNSQMYAPFLGMCFRERMQNKVVRVETITAMAQFILLYIIYNPNKEAYTQAEIATKLNISAMNMSRGIAELSGLQLITTASIGRSKYVKPITYGKELYELSKEYLQSPIQKKVYVLRENAYMDFLVAGEEALAMKTMLNPPRRTIRALDKKKIDIIPEDASVDPNWELDKDYIELELWKYNPECLGMKGAVDVISLALSLQNENDERIEEQIEEMMEEYRW